jgi:hypothetical protein
VRTDPVFPPRFDPPFIYVSVQVLWSSSDARCAAEVPVLRVIGGAQQAACHHAEDIQATLNQDEIETDNA